MTTNNPNIASSLNQVVSLADDDLDNPLTCLVSDRRARFIERASNDELIVTCTSPESALTLKRDLQLFDINAVGTAVPYILIVRPE